jgi:hypothetical protein
LHNRVKKNNQKSKERGPKWKKTIHCKLELKDEIEKKSKFYKRIKNKNYKPKK